MRVKNQISNEMSSELDKCKIIPSKLGINLKKDQFTYTDVTKVSSAGKADKDFVSLSFF